MSIELFLALFFPSHTSHLELALQDEVVSTVLQEEVIPENTEYCQTVYWYPNALELLDEAGCDIKSTESEIRKAKRG
ncbi:hypothetical protein LAT59_01940 [Candidatus Gracilibacteria bacterium]|nr:hypothetical protein [Candidatus Gracilibacteria bacterium]